MQFFNGSIPQLLERGKAESLRLNTPHYAGSPSPAVHSGCFAVLASIVSNGFDVQHDLDVASHGSTKGWFKTRKASILVISLARLNAGRNAEFIAGSAGAAKWVDVSQT